MKNERTEYQKRVIKALSTVLFGTEPTHCDFYAGGVIRVKWRGYVEDYGRNTTLKRLLKEFDFKESDCDGWAVAFKIPPAPGKWPKRGKMTPRQIIIRNKLLDIEGALPNMWKTKVYKEDGSVVLTFNNMWDHVLRDLAMDLGCEVAPGQENMQGRKSLKVRIPA